MTTARRADRRRILVFSASFGGSHAGVAEAIVRYFRTNHAADVEVRLVDFLEQLMPNVNVLAKFAYQRPDRFFPRLNGDLACAIAQEHDNAVVQELASGGYQRAVALLEGYRPDAVMSVLPAAAAVASEAAKSGGFVSAAVLTDFTTRDAWLHPRTRVYFVASRDASDALVVDGVEWGSITVSGIPISESSASGAGPVSRRKALGLPDRFTCLLAPLSGSSAEVPDIAARAAASGIQVAVAVGPSARLARSVAGLSKGSDLVRSFGPDVPVAELVAAADVVACRAGGSTLFSALSLGTPLIIYNPVPGQERFNVDYLVNCGAALLARDEEDVAEKLRFLSTHPDRLRQMAVDSGVLGRPDAARTICERVLAFVG